MTINSKESSLAHEGSSQKDLSTANSSLNHTPVSVSQTRRILKRVWLAILEDDLI
jgi:hypothetical protein